MQAEGAVAKIREALQRFQDGYTARDVSNLDEFMDLFVPGDEAEMVGIGASEREGYEWFQGADRIREIIDSDWTYWGDVHIDVKGARITALGDAAWVSTSGGLTQTQAFDRALVFYLEQMRALLEDDEAGLDERLVEATHYGMRRLRERHKGLGHRWPFVLTAVLVRHDGQWRFHTIHWSMPVD
jgi:hypothetical protein